MTRAFNATFAGLTNRIREGLGLQCRVTLPMAFICFLICFVHSILRNMKDALVITAPGASTEVVPFIQVWVLVPATLLATALFTWLSSRYSQTTLFTLVIGSFLGFFAVFGLILYPLRDVLHPHLLASEITTHVPDGLHGLVAMIRNWTFSIFFTVGELWACMVTAVLFWGFANAITGVNRARRSYGFYAMGGNLGSACAGLIPRLVSLLSPEASVYLILTLVMASGGIILVVFRWLTTTVLIGEPYDAIHRMTTVQKQCRVDTFRESLSSLYRSPYLLCLTVMILAYNIVLNVGELVWKDQLKQVCPDFNTLNSYLGYTTLTTGVGSVILAGCFPRIINRLGWTKTAMICPLALLISGCVFFGSLSFGQWVPVDINLILGFAVVSGGAMEVSGRMTKHSVFDATKDMAFIPLPHDVKLKGKAAIDGAVSRLGRSGAAALHQVLILVFSSIAYSVPAAALVLLVCVTAWLFAVRSLGRQFQHLTAEQDVPQVREVPVVAT